MLRYLLLLCSIFLYGCDQDEPIKFNSSSSADKRSATEQPQLTTEPKVATATVAYQPFPDGYGYMKNLKALKQATDAGDRKVIREHAWNLWAGMMQPAAGLDWPVWYTWPNTKQAFPEPPPPVNPVGANKRKTRIGASLRKQHSNTQISVFTNQPIYDISSQVINDYPNGVCKTLDSKTNKIVDTLCDGSHFLFNGDIMVPTESLSQQAMADIQNQKLYSTAKLDQLHKDKVHQIEVSPEFIVTKHMYWPGIPPDVVLTQANRQRDMDVFSWDSFVALNWPDDASGNADSGRMIGNTDNGDHGQLTKTPKL